MSRKTCAERKQIIKTMQTRNVAYAAYEGRKGKDYSSAKKIGVLQSEANKT